MTTGKRRRSKAIPVFSRRDEWKAGLERDLDSLGERARFLFEPQEGVPPPSVFSPGQILELRSLLGDRFDQVAPHLALVVQAERTTFSRVENRRVKSHFDRMRPFAAELREAVAAALSALDRMDWGLVSALIDGGLEWELTRRGLVRQAPRSKATQWAKERQRRKSRCLDKLLDITEGLQILAIAADHLARGLGDGHKRRGRVNERQRLETRVATCLYVGGCPLAKSRDGVLARVLQISSEAAGFTPPEDMFHIVNSIVDALGGSNW